MKIRIFKKKQIIVISAAIVMMTVGYFNYENNLIETVAEAQDEENRTGDVQLVSSTSTENIEKTDELNQSIETNVEESIDDAQKFEETFVSNNDLEVYSETSYENISDYFVSTRIERDTMYSQMLDTYQKIIDSQNISNEQKDIATQEISKITNTKNAIMTAENLIKSKGFEDVVILVNDNSINVIIKKASLNTAEVSQIQNIITRELNSEIENIHIQSK